MDELFVCDILCGRPTNDHVADAGLLLTLSSGTVSHGEESGTNVEKKPLLASE